VITSSGRALLIGAGALFVIGVLVSAWPMVAVAVAFAAAVGLARILFGSQGDLQYTRVLDRERVTRGEAAIAMLTVRNKTQRRIPSSQAIEPCGQQSITVPVPGLIAGAGRTLRYQIPSDRRCIMPIGPLRVERSDPFALVKFQRSVGAATILYVHPRRHALRRLPSTLLRSLDGPTSDRAPRGSVVFHAIREYVPGDDRRHIHWRSSARTGELKVRQFVDTSKPDVTVVLDIARNRHSEESFEEAIEVVASLMVATTDAGFPTHLVTSNGAEFTPSGPHPSQFLLDHLAGLEMSDTATLDKTLETLRKGGNTLCVVTRDLSLHEAALIAARKGAFHSILVALVDPEGNGLVEQIPPGVRVVRAPTAASIVGEWNVSIR